MSHSTDHDRHFPAIARYLRESMNCVETITEPTRPALYSKSSWPSPDVVGWTTNPMMHMAVDVKVTPEDCAAHLRKWHVVTPAAGVGFLRFIAAPSGMRVRLADGWGLLRIHDDGVAEEEPATPFRGSNATAERWLLWQALRAKTFDPDGDDSSRPDRRVARVIKALNGDPAGVQTLVKRTGMTRREVVSAVDRCEQLEIVKKHGGDFVQKA